MQEHHSATEDVKAEAIQYLSWARELRIDSSMWLDWLKEAIAKSNIPLVEIGTTGTELQNLFVECIHAKVCKHLEYARSIEFDSDLWLEEMEDKRKSINLSYEDLGTSRKEIAKLRAKIAKKYGPKIQDEDTTLTEWTAETESELAVMLDLWQAEKQAQQIAEAKTQHKFGNVGRFKNQATFRH